MGKIIREKKTVSGNLLEMDYYTVYDNGRRLPARASKSKVSTAAQQKYNRTVSIKNYIRKINANFDSTDYFMHPTYQAENAPQSEDEARRDIANYIRRVRRRRVSELKKLKKELAEAETAAAALPDNAFLAASVQKLKAKIKKLSQPLKYAYVIEEQIYKRGKLAGRSNWHFHLFLTGGIDATELEAMWKNGIRTNCNNYQPEVFGPEAAALYMAKDPRGAKRFVCSKNLAEPKTTVRDGKLTSRGVEKLAKERVDDAAYWERKHKGYRFMRCYNRLNPYNGQWYVSVVMYKSADAPPEWDAEDWITEDYA